MSSSPCNMEIKVQASWVIKGFQELGFDFFFSPFLQESWKVLQSIVSIGSSRRLRALLRTDLISYWNHYTVPEGIFLTGIIQVGPIELWASVCLARAVNAAIAKMTGPKPPPPHPNEVVLIRWKPARTSTLFSRLVYYTSLSKKKISCSVAVRCSVARPASVPQQNCLLDCCSHDL